MIRFCSSHLWFVVVFLVVIAFNSSSKAEVLARNAVLAAYVEPSFKHTVCQVHILIASAARYLSTPTDLVLFIYPFAKPYVLQMVEKIEFHKNVKIIYVDVDAPLKPLPRHGRYNEYFKFLKAKTFEYGNVLLCDARDVAFQGDPFLHLPSLLPHLFVSSPTAGLNKFVKILEDPFVASDIFGCYGRKELIRTKSQISLSVGAVIGPSQQIMSLSERIHAEVIVHPCKKRVGDQGILNSLYSLSKFSFSIEPFKISANASCFHMKQFPIPDDESTYIWDDDSRIQLFSGWTPVLIHEYDYHPVVQKSLFRKYNFPKECIECCSKDRQYSLPLVWDKIKADLGFKN